MQLRHMQMGTGLGRIREREARPHTFKRRYQTRNRDDSARCACR